CNEIANAFGGTFAISHKPTHKLKIAKEPPSQRTTKNDNMNGQTTYEKEGRRHNRRLAQWRVTWLIEHSTSHKFLWLNESIELRNPPLSPSAKTLQATLTDRQCNNEQTEKNTNRTNGTFGFAPPTSRPFSKTKRAIFCQRTNENINFETY